MYKVNFMLVKEYNFSLNEIDKMPPYARQIYISLLIDYLHKKKTGAE